MKKTLLLLCVFFCTAACSTMGTAGGNVYHVDSVQYRVSRDFVRLADPAAKDTEGGSPSLPIEVFVKEDNGEAREILNFMRLPQWGGKKKKVTSFTMFQDIEYIGQYKSFKASETPFAERYQSAGLSLVPGDYSWYFLVKEVDKSSWLAIAYGVDRALLPQDDSVAERILLEKLSDVLQTKEF